MKILQLLNEIHYEDFYSTSFQEFIKKYRKLKNDTSIYVNFNNHYNNAENKTMHADPTHGDPMGVYAYPLKYVIDHPMDVRYGKTSKFLRVLKRTDKGNVLRVQDEDDYQLNRIFFDETGLHFSMVEKYLKIIYGKDVKPRTLWFKAIQCEPSSLLELLEWAKMSKNKRNDIRQPSPRIKTAPAQNEMWKRHGYSTIIDSAKNQNHAVINAWEPEQAIFLKRSAFKTIEVFEMGRAKKDTSGVIVSQSNEYEDLLLKKVTAGVARGIGDRLIVKSKDPKKKISKTAFTAGMGGYYMYFTEKGRMIGCKLVRNNDDFQNPKIKFGEKIHKRYKKTDDQEIYVKIVSEKKTVELNFPGDARIDDIIPDIISAWHDEDDLNPNFTPMETSSDYEVFSKTQRTQQMYKDFADNFDRQYPESTVDAILKNLHDNFGVDISIAESYEDKFVAVLMASTFVSRQITYLSFTDEDSKKLDGDFYQSFLTEPPEICKLIDTSPLAAKQSLAIQKVIKDNAELLQKNLDYVSGRGVANKLQGIQRFSILKEVEANKNKKYGPDENPTTVPTKTVVALYRDKVTGQTWTGRGLRPKWVQAALDSGKTMEDLKA